MHRLACRHKCCRLKCQGSRHMNLRIMLPHSRFVNQVLNHQWLLPHESYAASLAHLDPSPSTHSVTARRPPDPRTPDHSCHKTIVYLSSYSQSSISSVHIPLCHDNFFHIWHKSSGTLCRWCGRRRWCRERIGSSFLLLASLVRRRSLAPGSRRCRECG